mgnify:CR=1 FL=1
MKNASAKLTSCKTTPEIFPPDPKYPLNRIGVAQGIVSVILGKNPMTVVPYAIKKETNGVTIKAVNPPTIPNCDWIFAVQSLIYVPAESVTAYQNDQCWSAYAQGILPIT